MDRQHGDLLKVSRCRKVNIVRNEISLKKRPLIFEGVLILSKNLTECVNQISLIMPEILNSEVILALDS